MYLSRKWEMTNYDFGYLWPRSIIKTIENSNN